MSRNPKSSRCVSCFTILAVHEQAKLHASAGGKRWSLWRRRTVSSACCGRGASFPGRVCSLRCLLLQLSFSLSLWITRFGSVGDIGPIRGAVQGLRAWCGYLLIPVRMTQLYGCNRPPTCGSAAGCAALGRHQPMLRAATQLSSGEARGHQNIHPLTASAAPRLGLLNHPSRSTAVMGQFPIPYAQSPAPLAQTPALPVQSPVRL